jgi:hypothetical protein
MAKHANSVVALVGAALILIGAVWLENVVGTGLSRAQRSFDVSRLGVFSVLAPLGVAGGCLVVGWLGIRASAIVAGVYAVTGAFLVALQWIALNLAIAPNGAPTVLPDALAQAVRELWLRTAGTLNAVPTIGAAMLIVGVVAIGRAFRRARIPKPAIIPVAADPVPQ